MWSGSGTAACVAADEAAGRDSWLRVYCVFTAGPPRASRTGQEGTTVSGMQAHTQEVEVDSNGISNINLAAKETVDIVGWSNWY